MLSLACTPVITVDDVLSATCACNLTEDDHGDLIEEYIDDVSDILYMLSDGRASGRCTRTVWPVTTDPCGPRPWPWWPSAVWNGIYPHHDYHDRNWLGTIPLAGPNTEILEVTIDGVVLNPSEYGLINSHELFRREGSWPSSNDYTLADTEVGTFTITYIFGPYTTATTKRAATELVCQMVTSDTAALSRLRGVVSANVQGVSIQMDPDEINQMGLPELSRWMDTYGGGRRGVMGVWSPELSHGWELLTVTGGSGS